MKIQQKTYCKSSGINEYECEYLSIFENIGEHYNELYVILPNHSPEVLQGVVLRTYIV